MASKSAKPAAEIATNILICVDDYGDGVLGGILYNQYIPKPIAFQGIVQLTGEMDKIFDMLSFPRASFAKRTFYNKKPEKDLFQQGGSVARNRRICTQDMLDQKGARGTFWVKVLFRQHASWQGTILWADKNKKQYFRSALEMIKLMDEALGVDSGTEGFSG